MTEDQGVASRQEARPQAEVGEGATPSVVTRNDLLRMLVNVTTALSACCDDTLRSVLATKIGATHRAAVALIELARDEDAAAGRS